MEECLSLAELSAVYETIHERDEDEFRRSAALQGVQIPTKEEKSAKEAIDRINNMAKARQPDKGLGALGLGYQEVKRNSD